LFNVIAGLDPAIHLHAKKMDPRVKPAGDGQKGGSTSPERALATGGLMRRLRAAGNAVAENRRLARHGR
jgi:hypothetical protein